jgi:hypothetical protein
MRNPLPNQQRWGYSIVPFIPIIPLAAWGLAKLIDRWAGPWGTRVMASLHAAWAVLLVIAIARNMWTVLTGKRRTLEELGLQNVRTRPHTFVIEPWGEDFTLLPGENMLLWAFGEETAPRFEVVEQQFGTLVSCEDTSRFEVTQNGLLLHCGHQRQRSQPS